MLDILLLVMCDNSINSNVKTIKEQTLELGFPLSPKFAHILNNSNTEESVFSQMLNAYSCISHVEVGK